MSGFIVLDNDPRIVYGDLASTNNSSTEVWEHLTWSVDGNTGTFATTSSPSAFLSLVFGVPVIGFEYWGFLQNTPGSCFIRLLSSSSPLATGLIDETANVPTEGNPGPPVMLFSTQLEEPAVLSVLLTNENAPFLDLVSFSFRFPSSTVDGGFPTPTATPAPVFTPASPVNGPPAPNQFPSPPSPVEPLSTPSPTTSVTTASQTSSLSNSLTIPTLPATRATIGPPLTSPSGSLASSDSNGPNNALPDSTPSSHSSKDLAGKIAGGVVGGLAFLALLGWLAYYYRVRRQRQANQSKSEVETPDSHQSIISSEVPASDIITPFPPVPRPDPGTAKLGGGETSMPPLQPVRPIPYGVKPSQMRPASLPAREVGPSQLPIGVLPRAKHASLPRAPEGSTSRSSASALANVPADISGSSSRAAQDVSRPMGPRRAVDGGPLAFPTEPPRNETITASPPAY